VIDCAWDVVALERSDNVADRGHAFAGLKRGYRQEPISRARSLSDLLINTISASENFIWMTGIRLDRLLKQRSALQNGFLFRFTAASRRFKEFVGRGGLPRDEISISFRAFILSPTNS
jgi:hypothetical protein